MKKHILYILILTMAIIAAVMTAARRPGELEISLEDSLYQSREEIPKNIKIIAIDEHILSDLGAFNEWDRGRFATLLKILNSDENNKPKVIGINFLFAGTDHSEGDNELVKVASGQNNIVLNSRLEFGERIVSDEDGYYAYEKYVKSEIMPFEPLASLTTPGFSNWKFGDDGLVREAYRYVKSGDIIYKSFATAVVEKYTGKKINENENETFIIPYSGRPGDFEIIPMSYLLSGYYPASYFANQIVLIGAYADSMMDSYKVPIIRSNEMYGVEIQANIISAMLGGREIYTLPVYVQTIICFVVILLFGILISYGGVVSVVWKTILFIVAYIVICIGFFEQTKIGMPILYIPIGAILMAETQLIHSYISLQKKRAEEMQKTLFSMADSMAEAIEGRTPYNASHTKNVAKRCAEMLEYINKLHRQKKTKMHFSANDKRQLYLAAMLHDIGKMDVPMKVMDKPTKLGDRIKPMKDRLEAILLRLELDSIKGRLTKEETEKNQLMIKDFISKIDVLNCGRPLNDAENQLIEDMRSHTYIGEDGTEIPYLTEQEYDDLKIKAGTLSDKERTLMQSHVVHTEKILSHVYFGDEYNNVKDIAANHHELLNGKGYPKQLSGDQLDTLTRILTIMDIYDSLIAEDRPYKKPKSVKEAFEILDEEADAGKVDKELLSIAKELYLTKENE